MILSIDFGTSNTAAALVMPDGSLRRIELEPVHASMPTALYFEGKATYFGSDALSAYLHNSDPESGRMMRGIKSLLGSQLLEEQTVINEKLVNFFEIIVIFLREVKRRAENEIGEKIRATMLGRPVHFVDNRPDRDALAQTTLEKAAHAAGFESVQFQLEPIAAAFDYERTVDRDVTVLVIDIGGGTSDFTVMRLGPTRVTSTDRRADILATTGVHIGGADFDKLLNFGFVMPLLGLGHVGPQNREVPSGIFFDLSTWHLIHHAHTRKSIQSAADMRSSYTNKVLHDRLMEVLENRHGHRILSRVEAAKIACSENQAEAIIDLNDIETALKVDLSPSGLASTLEKKIAEIISCAKLCVSSSKASAIDVVYLTGGSSGIRLLVDAAKEHFPNANLVNGDKFEGVVAGLAWYANSTRY